MLRDRWRLIQSGRVPVRHQVHSRARHRRPACSSPSPVLPGTLPLPASFRERLPGYRDPAPWGDSSVNRGAAALVSLGVTQVEPPAQRARTIVRELGLAGLIAVVTWSFVNLMFDPAWSFPDFADCSGWWVGIMLTATVLLGFLRLRFPLVALACAAALFGAWPPSGGLLALTAFHAAGHVRPVRRLRIALGLAALIDSGTALLVAQYGWTIVVAGHAVALLVCVGLPVVVQAVLGKADGVIAALRERTYYLEDNYRLAHSAARLQERSRIAQEMHDQLGHRLSLISLYCGALELTTASDAPKAADEARLIRGTVHAAMHELRSTLGMLRAADADVTQLQPVEETGTRTDLTNLVAQSRSAGVPVELIWHGPDLADAALPVRRAAHRLVREGLTNIHRHAFGARAWVTVDSGPGRVRVEVASSRPPSVPVGTGMGLVGVQERVRLLGGAFSAGATTAGGFRMLADIPLTALATQNGQPHIPNGKVAPTTPEPRDSRGLLRRTLGDGRGITAVLAVALAGIPAVVGPLLDTAAQFVPGSTPYVAPLDAVRIGMPRQKALTFISDDSVARLAAKTIETTPPGDSCVYTLDLNPRDGWVIARYCFRGDLVIAVDQFPVPGSD